VTNTQTVQAAPANRRTRVGTQLSRIPLWLLAVVGALIVVVVALLSLLLNSHIQTSQNAADTANANSAAIKSQAAPLAGQVQSVCNSGGVAATQLAASGACTQAQRVQSVVAIPGPTGPQGPGPSQSQIDDAVNRYFAAHPLPAGQLPPVSEVASLVATYLAANPPAPGANATPQMVTDAVTNYCGSHNGCAGPAGQNATDSQVATEVANYCAAHDNCAGPQGTAGANGQNGTNGTNGVNGKPPATYTVLVPAVVGPATTETCTRTNTDDSNPTYACA
jgi:hypothetical protein